MMQEEKFILTAARTKLSEENVTVLRALSDRELNWEWIESLAVRHDVAPFIYYSLIENGLKDIFPNRIYEKFKTIFLQTAVHNSIFLEELSKIARIIKNNLILLKGIDLIQNCYPHIGIRPMKDIDILIRHEFAKENWSILSHSNYKARYSQNKSPWHGQHLPPLYKGQIRIEIHNKLFKGNRCSDISKDIVNQSTFYENNIYRLSNEFMLIHLCYHFYKHWQSGANLKMLCDINEFILMYQDAIDWKKIENTCRIAHLKKEIHTALTFAHVLLDTPIPQMTLLNHQLHSVTFSSIMKYQNRRSVLHFLCKVKRIQRSKERGLFLWKTLFPDKVWLIEYQYTTPAGRLSIAYLKYWIVMFNRHFLEKETSPEK